MANWFLDLGVILTVGFLVGRLTNELGLTSVVGYLLAGMALGPDLVGLVSFDRGTVVLITVFTISLVLFEMGTRLTPSFLKEMGAGPLVITFSEAGASFLFVAVGVNYLLRDLPTALLLGSLASATAPVSRLMVIQELNAEGPLTSMSLETVEFDNILAIILFGLSVGVIDAHFLSDAPFTWVATQLTYQLGGAILVGVASGTLLAWVIDEFRERDFRLVMAVAAVMLSAGVSEFMGFSTILAPMTTGIVMASLLPELSDRTREPVEELLPPVHVVFFVLVGASANLGEAAVLAGPFIVYVTLRLLAKVSGSFVGASVTRAPEGVKRYFGLSMLSHAGVAVGLALLVHNELPGYFVESTGMEIGHLVVTVIALSSVAFEMIGPLGVKFSLIRAGEAPRY